MLVPVTGFADPDFRDVVELTVASGPTRVSLRTLREVFVGIGRVDLFHNADGVCIRVRDEQHGSEIRSPVARTLTGAWAAWRTTRAEGQQAEVRHLRFPRSQVLPLPGELLAAWFPGEVPVAMIQRELEWYAPPRDRTRGDKGHWWVWQRGDPAPPTPLALGGWLYWQREPRRESPRYAAQQVQKLSVHGARLVAVARKDQVYVVGGGSRSLAGSLETLSVVRALQRFLPADTGVWATADRTVWSTGPLTVVVDGTSPWEAYSIAQSPQEPQEDV